MLSGSEQKVLIWVSKVLRWALGTLFIIVGIHAGNDGYAIFFGTAIFATGFLKPRRCIDDKCSAIK